jgi:peptidoglycan biosynthesis protein MviN/MurJ (putative lipid II flippase)
MLLRSIATVGGFTLLSRVVGFLRDLFFAALLGAGPVADAFVVAFRLPNLFRALSAEGPFRPPSSRSIRGFWWKAASWPSASPRTRWR